MMLCCIPALAGAADVNWDAGAYVSGSDSSRHWDLPGNWDPDGVPGAGQTALIGAADTYARANADLPGSPAIEVTTGGLLVQSAGVNLSMPLTLSGGTLHLGASSADNWGADRVLNGSLTVAAPSFLKGRREQAMRINGVLAGDALLTFAGSDSYQGNGPDWLLYGADSLFAGGMLLESTHYPQVRAMANRVLGTGDITIRANATLAFSASQDYSGAARTPILYLEDGRVEITGNNITLPFDTVVQAAGGRISSQRWAAANTYGGNLTLNGDLTLASARVTNSGTALTVTGPMAGSGAVIVKTTDVYEGSRGVVVLANANNSYEGGTTVLAGYLRATCEGALSTGSITLHKPDAYTKLVLDKTPSDNWSLAQDLVLGGPLQVEDGSADYTLTCAGSTVTVGADGTTATTASVLGNLAFARDGATPATLNIDVIKAGDPAVVANDVLAVSRSVSGLSNLVLNVTITDASYLDLASRPLTILLCDNDLAGEAFADVVYPDGWTGIITCGNGSVQLQLAPAGEDSPVIAVQPETLSFSVKSTEPNPAPAAVQVLNVGFGTSSWTAAVRSPAPSWISLSNATGTDNESFNVQVDRQGLAVGTYTAYVDVTDPNAPNSPQTLTVLLQARPEAEASTRSFTSSSRGTHPGALSVSGGTITVDLSALPAGTQVFRAILAPDANGSQTTPLRIQAADQPGVWLATQAPRHRRLDCTAATQRAMAGSRTLELNVVSLGGGLGSHVRLDVWCDAPPAGPIQQVTGLSATHRNGDTMLTFAEVDPPVTHVDPTYSEIRDAKAAMEAAGEVRYRIYRSAQPIDALTIRTAELVDEITAMSGWNWNITTTSIIPTLPVDDMTPSTPGTGIYVRRADAAGSAYYAVSRAVNGEEDLSLWMPTQNSLASAVTEDVGPGVVLQYSQIGPASWFWENNVTRRYYVRWECPPTWNLPSTAHNYLVAEPDVQADPRAVDVALHCWGGTMDEGYGWWYEAKRGSLLVATNQIPYDWWTAFHENWRTIRPWREVEGNGGGRLRNYNQQRIWSFVTDFVAQRWNVNMNRVIVSGESMGGSGASMWGMRAGDKFAYIASWVGVHIPALTPTYLLSFEDAYGQIEWDCLYSNGMSVWDYWDNDQWLRSNVAVDTPFIAFANGKNDGGIGWRQAWMMARALQETRRPHLFKWGQNGHQERAALPGTLSDRHIHIDIDLNATLPAFTYCSLDNDPGDGNPKVGESSGYLNAYMLWQPEDSVDTAARWEMTCLLINAAPQATCTVDVTPRRCQAFAPRPTMLCRWVNTDAATGTVIESGTVEVDAYGLVTVPQTTVTKGKNRLAITIAGDIHPDGAVNAIDLLRMANSWGKVPGDVGYDPACDIDGSGSINAIDLLILARNFAK